MGLFNFFKKPAEPQAASVLSIAPYKDSATNYIYNLFFCDDIDLYKQATQQPYTYPFDVLFSKTSSIADLQHIIEDENSDPRIKVLAYNKQLKSGYLPIRKELLAVIVEVGLENGLDVLASFCDGTARYINHTGKILVWEKTDDDVSNKITRELFLSSRNIVDRIGPWNKPRLPDPGRGDVRITFFVTDGLYFGEGPINVLFNDELAGTSLAKAAELMQYLTQKSLESEV